MMVRVLKFDQVIRQLSFCFYVIFMSLMMGCDNNESVLMRLNQPPVFIVNDEPVNIIIDSLKKFSTKAYNIELNLVDTNQNIERFSYELVSSSGEIYINGNRLDSNTIPINEFDNLYKLRLRFVPAAFGTSILNFNVVDSFGEEGELRLEIVVFRNLKPVAIVEAIRPEGSVEFERIIDASESYDPDKKFGGGIVEYEFSFLGKEKRKTSPQLPIIFPEKGNYRVTVRVRDSDFFWSELVGININI